jgi:hypothetical protein
MAVLCAFCTRTLCASAIVSGGSSAIVYSVFIAFTHHAFALHAGHAGAGSALARPFSRTAFYTLYAARIFWCRRPDDEARFGWLR